MNFYLKNVFPTCPSLSLKYYSISNRSHVNILFKSLMSVIFFSFHTILNVQVFLPFFRMTSINFLLISFIFSLVRSVIYSAAELNVLHHPPEATLSVAHSVTVSYHPLPRGSSLKQHIQTAVCKGISTQANFSAPSVRHF